MEIKHVNTAQSGLAAGVCQLARLPNEICNITSILHVYYSGMLNSTVVCVMLNRVGYCKTFMKQQVLMGLLSGLCCFSHVAMAEPTEAQGATLSNIHYAAIEVSPDAQASITAPSAPETWGMYGQFTGVSQSHPAFAAPYTGQNSLLPNSSSASTTDLTLFIGMHIWGGELWVNPEIDLSPVAPAVLPESHRSGRRRANHRASG
jgi:hypothetical protein